MPVYNFLFNFAVSYLGGGYKRLYAYADWFNRAGGASFVIHPTCRALINEFPNNRFFVVRQTQWQRLYKDTHYLQAIRREMGTPYLYYAYGIPVYTPFGRVNWFHLCNVLPFRLQLIDLRLLLKLKQRLLQKRITKHYAHADVIVTESHFSQTLISPEHAQKALLSIHGNDDELHHLNNPCQTPKENTAILLGTWHHKALLDAYQVFKRLQAKNPGLQLIIIGRKKEIPTTLKRQKQVTIAGYLSRNAVTTSKSADFIFQHP